MKKEFSTFVCGWLYSFVHFSVEVCCFFFLFSRLKTGNLWWGYALLFDALAFVPQSLLGIRVDSIERERMGMIGCVLLLGALILPYDIPAFLMLSLGNAMVHISGAKHTLSSAQGKITPCSAFVAGGSFGVITGQLLGTFYPDLLWIAVCFMTISFIMCVAMYFRHPIIKGEICTFRVSSTTLPLGWVVLLACLSTAIRSYVAYAVPTAWKKETYHAIFLFCSMGIGKYLGGVLCDRIGYQKTATLSLIFSLPFLLFGNSMMTLSLIGVGLFSMTMPVTVGILVSVFPKSPAFAFGLTTVALFMGVIPVFFFRPEGLLVNQMIVLILTILAAVSLKFSIGRRC